MHESTLPNLINSIEQEGVLKSPNIRIALKKVDRAQFVPETQKHLAYFDMPLGLAEGQTISQPTTVVFMLELLGIKKNQKILDIGAGSGWVSCLASFLTAEKGSVFSYEINAKVGKIGLENIKKCRFKNIIYKVINASRVWKDNAPYDRIYSGAAFEKIPKELKELLVIGGILVAPLLEGSIIKIVRTGEKSYSEEKYYGFAFVPFREK